MASFSSSFLCYWNTKKELYFVKRFLIEVTTKKYRFIEEECELTVACVDYQPKVKISFNKRLKETKDLNDKIVDVNKIVDVKGDKAKGNQLTRLKVKEITLMDVLDGESWPVVEEATIIDSENENNEPVSLDFHENMVSTETPKSKVENKEVKTEIIQETDLTDDNSDSNSPINVNTNSEGSVELEWDVELPKDEDNSDEDGQMKIF